MANNLKNTLLKISKTVAREELLPFQLTPFIKRINDTRTDLTNKDYTVTISDGVVFVTLGLIFNTNSNTMEIMGNSIVRSTLAVTDIEDDFHELGIEYCEGYVEGITNDKPVKGNKITLITDTKEVVTNVLIPFTIDEIETLQGLAEDTTDCDLKTIILNMCNSISSNKITDEEVEALKTKFN